MSVNDDLPSFGMPESLILEARADGKLVIGHCPRRATDCEGAGRAGCRVAAHRNRLVAHANYRSPAWLRVVWRIR